MSDNPIDLPSTKDRRRFFGHKVRGMSGRRTAGQAFLAVPVDAGLYIPLSFWNYADCLRVLKMALRRGTTYLVNVKGQGNFGAEKGTFRSQKAFFVCKVRNNDSNSRFNMETFSDSALTE